MKFPLRFVTTTTTSKDAAAPVGDDGVSSLTFRSTTSSKRNLYNLLTIRLSKTKLASTPSKASASAVTAQGSTTIGQRSSSFLKSRRTETIPILPLQLPPSGRRESTGDVGAENEALSSSRRRQSGDCITIPEEELQEEEVLEAEVAIARSSHPRFVYSVNDPVDLFTSSLTFYPTGGASGHL